MDDPGLLILPTHRMLTGLADGYNCDRLAEETRDVCQWKTVKLTDALLDNADGFLKPFGPGAMAFLDGRLGTMHVGKLTKPEVMARLASEQVEDWRRLDVAILHRLILDEYVTKHAPGGLNVAYTAHGREVGAALKGGAVPDGHHAPGHPAGGGQADRPGPGGHAAQEHVLLPQAGHGDGA